MPHWNEPSYHNKHYMDSDHYKCKCMNNKNSHSSYKNDSEYYDTNTNDDQKCKKSKCNYKPKKVHKHSEYSNNCSNPCYNPGSQDGISGPSCSVGPSGPSGPDGSIGPSGPSGPDGSIGPSGPDGSIGPIGPSGPDGSIGPSGPGGQDGTSGSVGPSGPSGPGGPSGPSGPPGFGFTNAITGNISMPIIITPPQLSQSNPDIKIELTNIPVIYTSVGTVVSLTSSFFEVSFLNASFGPMLNPLTFEITLLPPIPFSFANSKIGGVGTSASRSYDNPNYLPPFPIFTLTECIVNASNKIRLVYVVNDNVPFNTTHRFTFNIVFETQ